MEKEPTNTENTSESILENTIIENNIHIVPDNSGLHECEYDKWYSE